MKSRPDVLVVGAGPTGLTAALQAHEHGATVRVVERRTEAFRPSRAMVVHPRALECLRPLDVTDAILDRADRAPTAHLHLGRRRVEIRLDNVALPDTAFPHLTVVRQTDVESVLANALAQRGVVVERGVELVAASTGITGARATLVSNGTIEEAHSEFIVGCDGQGSTVRRSAAIGFTGAPYDEEIVLADVELVGELTPGVIHVVADRAGLVFVFALGEGATWRLMATRPAHGGNDEFGQPGQMLPAAEVQQILDETRLNVTLTDMRWSGRVRLQRRLADSFRNGRLFLAGDAAHTHSPAAAQGMNTGIIDAANLGWKLAFAAATGGSEDLLSSYEQERRPVARQVLALTRIVFTAEASRHRLVAGLRETVLPLTAPVVSLLVRQRLLMALVVRLLSQGWVHYRHSPLSVRGSPASRGPRPGDRFPDQEVTHQGQRIRLHQLIGRPGVHVLLHRDAAELDIRLLGAHVVVHRITNWPGEGLVAVRPDGHVGFTCARSDHGQLIAWLEHIGAGPTRQIS